MQGWVNPSPLEPAGSEHRMVLQPFISCEPQMQTLPPWPHAAYAGVQTGGVAPAKHASG